MANIIRGKNQSTTTQPETDLNSTDFGPKTAIAAFQKTTQSTKQAPGTTQGAEAKAQRRASKQETRSKQKTNENNLVKQREEQTYKLVARGTVNGAVARANRDLAGRRTATSGAQVQDAWEDPTEVSNKDGVDTAIEKRLARAQEETSRIESQISEEATIGLENIEGLNGVSQPIRDHGNYSSLNENPELLLALAGLSETFDNLLQQNGIVTQNPTEHSDTQLQEIFALLNTKKKKKLSEDEEEAELILSGAVAMLAIPRIEEKLIEMGLNPKDAKSFHGALKQLLDKVSQDDSPYNHLYTMIKEETDLSIIPEEVENSNA